MSLARGLTRRMKRSGSDAQASTPSRSQSMKNPTLQIDRAKISSPVALLSTTNMKINEIPDLPAVPAIPLRHASSSTSSTLSAEDSDHSASTARSRSSSHGSRDTLTDASSVGSSPTSPKPNHLSGYFAAANSPTTGKGVRRSVSSGNLQYTKAEPVEPVPAVPERALSHSKRAHERLAHKRSLQNMQPRGSLNSTRSSREHRTSADMFSATIVEESHPFGKELEQLNEVAEEFGGVVRDAEFEADMTVIRERGLASFCASEYLDEIKPLFHSRFGNPYVTGPMAWI